MIPQVLPASGTASVEPSIALKNCRKAATWFCRDAWESILPVLLQTTTLECRGAHTCERRIPLLQSDLLPSYRRTGRLSSCHLSVEPDGSLLIKFEPLPGKQSETSIDCVWVVEDATIMRNLLQCLVYTKGRPVGPVGRHGFDDVGYS
jgi:hypothetical protein